MITWTLVKRQGIFVVRMRVRQPGSPRGKRKQCTTRLRHQGPARMEALRIVEREELALQGRKPSCTLRELGQEWLALNSNTASDSHWKSMERHLRLHFGPLLDLDLKEVTTERVKEALNDYRADHGETSALTWRRYLRVLFGWAINSDRIQTLPWKNGALGKMNARERPRPVLPVGKWKPWLDAVRVHADGPEDPRPLIAALLLATGIREMEAVRARWEGANLDAEHPTYTPGLTKGGAAVPRALPGWLVALLRPLQQAQGWMFPDPRTGRPFARGCCRRLILAANAMVGTPGIMHHRLRASVATLLLARVTPRDAQLAFEHKDPRTTLGYNEHDPSAVREALNQLGELAGLGGCRTGAAPHADPRHQPDQQLPGVMRLPTPHVPPEHPPTEHE